MVNLTLNDRDSSPMKKLIALGVLAASLCLSHAQIFYQASLDPAQDGGGARSGSGVGSFTLNGNIITYNVTFSGLSAPTIAAHIHGSAPPGVNAPVLFPFTGPFGTTSGTFSGTTAPLTVQQISDLNAGLFYANIHTVNFGGGEIRGQITAVPEPTTLALLSASGLLALAVRRKKA